MLVVLAIIVIITTIALASQSSFNQTLLLTNAAYDLGVSLRQAESYGISSKSFFTGALAVPNAGYGVHFASSPASALRGYTFFADIAQGVTPPAWCPVGAAGTPSAKPGDCLFEANLNETVQSYTYTRGFSIAKFCGTRAGTNQWLCSGADLDGLDVVFVRPNTEAVITGRNGNAAWQLANATVYLTSPQGGTRCVAVTNTGEISVSASCP